MPDPLQGVRIQMQAFWEQQVAKERVKKEEAILKNKRGVELFTLILEGIHEVYDVNGVIAGGAVRDVAAGHTLHKDVDVFLPMDWKRFSERVNELGWKAVAPIPVPAGYAKKGVVSRANGVVQDLVIDLIFQEKPMTVDDLSKFPIYAQRGMFTLDRGLFVTEECQKDVNDKTFTIDPKITNKDTVKGLKAKVAEWKQRLPYADFRVVEPETQEWWEAEEALKKEEPKKQPINWDEFMLKYGDVVLVDRPVRMIDPWADLVRAER